MEHGHDARPPAAPGLHLRRASCRPAAAPQLQLLAPRHAAAGQLRRGRGRGEAVAGLCRLEIYADRCPGDNIYLLLVSGVLSAQSRDFSVYFNYVTVCCGCSLQNNEGRYNLKLSLIWKALIKVRGNKSRIEYGRIYVENIHMEEFLMLRPSTYSSGNIGVPPFITLHVCAILGSYSGAVWRDQLSCSECGTSRVVGIQKYLINLGSNK